MNQLAQIRTEKLETLSNVWLLPGLLAVNTAALLALDSVGGIPGWVKSAVALFLAF